MASEELESNYHGLIGKKVGDYEMFSTQLATVNQYVEHGLLPDREYKNGKRKFDKLIVRRGTTPDPLVIGDDKASGTLTAKNWRGHAEKLHKVFAKPTGALLGYVTDTKSTYWINAQADDIELVEREDGKPMPQILNYDDETVVAEIVYVINNFDPRTGKVLSGKKVNPTALSVSVWQTIWRLRADRPEDCLATFVEIFIYKFLNDLGLMRKDSKGRDVSLGHILKLNRDKVLEEYFDVVRPYIKELFPSGSDGYSVINGIVLQKQNRDHNIIFHELLKKFVRFGSLKNTDPEFKTRLYETFLQESDTTNTFGQFFTPRKVVGAVHDMAGISTMSAGKSICDPAAGVGGFVLEPMARDLEAQWTLKENAMEPKHVWHSFELIPKTAILAKANALVHCGDLLAEQPGRIAAFAAWINKVFTCVEKTALGTLERMDKDKFDVIITNPPFVVSGSADFRKLIAKDAARKAYFARKYSGIEGLFVQYIVQALKKSGDAWVLLPEAFLLRTPDELLRKWILQNCAVDLVALLPERTFFNTPKRVVILHMKKRDKLLAPAKLDETLKNEKVLVYAVGEIGETRDAKRFPIADNDLPELVKSYALHKANISIPYKRAALISATAFGASSFNVRHAWSKPDARALGLLTSEDDPVAEKAAFDKKMVSLKKMATAFIAGHTHITRPCDAYDILAVKCWGSHDYLLENRRPLLIGRAVLRE
ncbi:HsdM family class I SAM-dependent methyltransferase, partial [Methylacidimicrobium tartarophylax]